jgi:tetratricopeptide (TPR) repeat protein
MWLGPGQFTDRESALAAFKAITVEDSPERILIYWGVSGQGKSMLLHQLPAVAAHYRCELIDLETLANYSLAAAGRLDEDLATLLLNQIARLLARWSPSRSERRWARYERRALSARKEFNTFINVVVSQSATRGGSIIGSPIHVDARQPVGVAAYSAYRHALVIALSELASDQDYSGCVLMIDTTERLRYLDDAALEQDNSSGWVPNTGVRHWFTSQVVPVLQQHAPALRIVLAGQEDLVVPPQLLARHVELVEWELADTAQYLATCGLDISLAPAIHTQCHGVPVWTALVAELCMHAIEKGELITTDWLTSVARGRPAEQWLPAVFMARLTPAQQQVVRAAAVLRTISEEAASSLLSDVRLPPDWYRALCSHSFVQMSRDSTGRGERRIHELVRTALLAYMYKEQPNRLEDLHRRAAAYFAGDGLILEEMYHRFASGDYALAGEWQGRMRAAQERHDLATMLTCLEIVLAPEQSAKLSQSNPQLLATAERYAGEVAIYRAELSTAQAILDKALSRFQRIGDRAGEANTRQSIGKLHQRRDDQATAQQYFEQALAIYQSTESRQGEAEALSALARILLVRGQPGHAEEYLNAALQIHQELENNLGEADTLQALGEVARARGDMNETEIRLTRALEIYRQMEQPMGEANTLHLLGVVQFYGGKLKDAEDSLINALRMHRRIENRLGEATVLGSLARMHMERGDLRGAEAHLRRALEINKEIESKLGEASVLRELGTVSTQLVELERGQDYYMQSLAIFREIGHRGGEAILLQALGHVRRGLEDLQGARIGLLEALRIHQEIENRLGEANTLGQLADVLAPMGDLDAAEQYAKRALPIFQEIGDILGEANTLESLGEVLIGRDDFDGAEEHLSRALDLYKQISSPLGEAMTLNCIGTIYLARDAVDDAESCFQSALSLYQRIENRWGEAQVMASLGQVEAHRGKYDRAQDWMSQAYELFGIIGMPDAQSAVRQQIDELERARRSKTE